MKEWKPRIKALAREFLPEIIEIRRHFHQYPELSFQEYNTSAYICSKLDSYGIAYKDGYVKTGIVGTIEGIDPSSRTVALRADMDALPVDELNNVPYRSQNKGIMHACGHDAHMAVLMGAAKILQQIKDTCKGRILLIFQPGEEKIPGGANQMLDEGALLPKPDVIIGQHVMPQLASGKVAFRPGTIMASADEIYLTVKGKGGHAAMPQEVIDPVLITSHILIALQQIVSRNAHPASPTVLSFGKVEAPGATNVIPPEVKIEGSLRAMNEEWRFAAHKKIKCICTSVAQAMSGQCEVEIRQGYPVLKNDPAVTHKAKEYTAEMLGSKNVVDLDIEMTAEDFAYYAQKIPATFYRLGTGHKPGITDFPLHSPSFNIDENALLTGMETLSWITLNFLSAQ